MQQYIFVFAFVFSSTFQILRYLGRWSAVLINFSNTEALEQSGNPCRTVGNGHSNNNNTKSNLNYALKRLGQNNPQNIHKWGGGEVASDQIQGWDLKRLCVDIFFPDCGICVKLCFGCTLGVILGKESMSAAQRGTIIKVE